MFNHFKKTIEWAGSELTLETGKIARQADGAVLVTYGETSVLCTAVSAKTVKPGQDFFPLTVNYQEKSYAAGKIPGGFFKREGRPSEIETLTSRLIDRPIRPLFPANFLNEVQVTATVLSHDRRHDSGIVALIGCSAALTLSGIPFQGPVGAARVGCIDGKLVINPTVDRMQESTLDLVVAGTKDGVLMVESEAQELSEDEMLAAVMKGHEAFQPVLDLICDLAELAAREPWTLPELSKEALTLRERVGKLATKPITDAYKEKQKQKRQEKITDVKERVMAAIEKEGLDLEAAKPMLKEVEAQVVRGSILKTGLRIDGRDLKTVRPIVSEVNALRQVHGSALFTRGETQALVIATLGGPQDGQVIDAIEGEHRSNFMLHYNFPLYSVGECGRMGSPGRREIGHGKLAWRAIHPLLPSKTEFNFTIRVVSEITESNGSSSMATVCGTSLALMDAGVPLRKPVAGIAMGLIKEDRGMAVLTDILGDEDHLGDMDFKVAGTRDGVTALQMDIKITSITKDIMKTALEQARDGRLHILGEMAKALEAGRPTVSDNAPKVTTLTVPKEKIRDVIGSGGKVIRDISETSGARVDIADDGTVTIIAQNNDQAKMAISRIEAITAEPEVGRIYDGKVVKTADFGAFVNFLGPRDGLVHISELANSRVSRTTDIVKQGDQVKVKVIGFDDRGKVKLSMRVVDQESGADISDTVGDKPSRAPRQRDGE
ncbi:MAG: polyribonucleotide nucleotidyltransferase [Acetobacteraceae bacterium]